MGWNWNSCVELPSSSQHARQGASEKLCSDTMLCVKHSLAFISGLQIKFLWEVYKLQFREKKLLEIGIPFFLILEYFCREIIMLCYINQHVCTISYVFSFQMCSPQCPHLLPMFPFRPLKNPASQVGTFLLNPMPRISTQVAITRRAVLSLSASK